VSDKYDVVLRAVSPVREDGPGAPVDLVLRNELIVKQVPAGKAKGNRMLDAEGLWAMPAMIDPHVHFRYPGFSYKEDIESGLAAAGAGGYCCVAIMPNTEPPIDSPDVVEEIFRKVEALPLPHARLLVVAAASVGREGKEPVDFPALQQAGVCGFSDDGAWIESEHVLTEALVASAGLGLPVMEHCEVPSIVRNGVVNKGKVSKFLGLSGRPRAGETEALKRDLRILEKTGGRLHVQHLSAAESVDMVREAKAKGLEVTAEVTLHHLLLDEDVLLTKDPDYKVNPPLRTKADRLALMAGLRDGTIDMVATDHAPHAAFEKAAGLELAPAGAIGLETALALMLLVKDELGFKRVLEATSSEPAKLLGLPAKRTVIPGSPADLVLIDPDAEWEVRPDLFRSKSRNSPFKGWKLKGRVVYTLVSGKIVFDGR